MQAPDQRTSPARRAARVARRVFVVGSGAGVTIALLFLFFAWIALRIPWSIPDRAALTGPTVVLDREGREIARFSSTVDRRVVDLDDVALDVRNAIIASEDARFYEHGGVDPVSLLRAVVSNITSDSITQGGSTLTQQYVKNAYLTPERTLTRKIREAVLSIALERQMGKDEILEAYLNQVYFGELAWGIEAAAQTYWGVPASQLDAGQGATLAQLLPAPSTRNPRVDPDGALVRRNRILQQMATLGMITPAEAEAEMQQPIVVLPRRDEPTDAPVFIEYVRRQLVAIYGEEAVQTGALTVRTTIDRDVQAALEAAVTQHLPAEEAGHVEASAVAVDPNTGAILGIWPGRGYGPESSIDLATQYRSIAGSTFKPFVFLTALQQGRVPTDTYPAPASVLPTNCPPNEDGSNPFTESVSNAGGRGYGNPTLSSALTNSVNTVFIALGCDVTPQAVADTADALGVRTPLDAVPFIALGNPPLGPTTLDMASAFATLANDGVHCPAHAILSVRRPDGSIVTQPDEVVLALDTEQVPRRHSDEWLAARPEALQARDFGTCYGVADADQVRATTTALEGVVAETTGRRADIGRPQAGKTGTADDETFAWFVGYTPDIAIAVQVSDPLRDPARIAAGEVREPMRNVAGFSSVQGGTIPALIWKSAAEAILADVTPRDFPEPGEVIGTGGIRPAPERPKPVFTYTPEPTPTEDPDASESDPDGPGPSPSPRPSGQPSDEPSPEPTPTDDDGCFLVFC